MSDNKEQMAPDASPGEITKKTGVRRVNKVPLFIGGGVITAFALVMALVAANRAEKQNAPAQVAKEKGGNSTMFAKSIAGEQKDGIIPPASPLPVPDLPGSLSTETQQGAIMVAKPENLELPPTPPGGVSANGHMNPPTERDEEAVRIHTAKLQQLEEAIKAKTGVTYSAPRSSASAPGLSESPPQTRNEVLSRIQEVKQQAESARASDPTATYKARLAQIQASGIIPGLNPDSDAGQGGGSGSAPSMMQTAANSDSYGQFSNGNSNNATERWKLKTKMEPPHSAFELRAGFVIPGTLISGINSELPGQIVAQVAQSVYDTPTGNHLLIPQGSRLVGSYDSQVKYGQARVLVAWQRIVFPDGKALDIGAMPGSDSAGYSGFNDEVNNHYLRLFGSAILMSGITAGITMSQGTQTTTVSGQQSASSALSQALGQQLGQATAQLISKNMSIAPTLEIRPGYRFNVVVTKDLTFTKPYQSFDY